MSSTTTPTGNEKKTAATTPATTTTAAAVPAATKGKNANATPGATQSNKPAAAAPTTVAQQQSGKTAVANPLKNMPKMKGQATGGGRRGGNEVKRLLYMLFSIPYGNWTGYGTLIANGAYKNHWAEGVAEADRTSTNRMWIVQDLINGAILHTGLEAAMKAITLGANQVCRPWITIEAGEKVASFVKCADLTKYYLALIATESAKTEGKNEANIAKWQKLADTYGAENDYAGFCCATAENIGKVQDNIRGYFFLNPESKEVFTELKVYSAAWGQENMADIANAALAETAAVK